MQAKTKSIVATFDAYQGEKTGRTIPAGTTFGYLVKNGTWLQLTSGVWVNGGANWQYVELIGNTPTPPVDPPVTPPVADPSVRHKILVDDQGRISVDGLPYV